jgi:hypothetical protein
MMMVSICQPDVSFDIWKTDTIADAGRKPALLPPRDSPSPEVLIIFILWRTTTIMGPKTARINVPSQTVR